jgi:hypothetical protein
MKKTGLYLLLLLVNPVFFFHTVSGASPSLAAISDTSRESQVLYSGRVWRNLYSRVVGDQFLFAPEFIQSSVFIEGRTFDEVPLRYDIYKDELITQNKKGFFIQLNKEHVDSFNLAYTGKVYRFINLDYSGEPSGYIRVLYNGNVKYYVKYRKNIELLAVEKKYDSFYQVRRMYLVKDSVAHFFNGRLELFRLFGDYSRDVRSYMKKNRIKILRNDPESFVPLIQYYDRLKKN